METQFRSLDWKDPLEKEMANHSSILAWRIPGQRSLVDYSPWGHNESDMTEQLNNNNQRRIFSTPPKGFGPRQCRSRQISLPLFQWWSCGSARQAADPEEGSKIRPLCPLSNSAMSNSW